MKKILYISFIALLLSCSTNKGEGVIEVKALFPEAGTNLISWLDIFQDVEMIALAGEQLPMFGTYCKFIAHNNSYYIIEYGTSQKIHRFDKSGRYLNSIGTQGRGPEEYTFIQDVTMDDHGNIAVSSFYEDDLVIYSPDGTFIGKRELPFPARYFSHNGFNYHFVGLLSGQGYQLYVTDKDGQSVGEFLPQPQSAPLSFPPNTTFSLYDNTVNFCPAEGNEIYQLKDGKMEVKYRFDFGSYSITDEYYRKTMDELVASLSSNPVVYKYEFFESKHCAVLMTVIQGDINMDPIGGYGVLDKKKDTWRWFNWKDDSIFLVYIDDEYAYFTASAELMRELPGSTERFPLLNTVTESNDTVILKCKTESIKL